MEMNTYRSSPDIVLERVEIGRRIQRHFETFAGQTRPEECRTAFAAGLSSIKGISLESRRTGRNGLIWRDAG